MHKLRKKDIVREIRSGITDDEMMEKYGLPLNVYQRLLQVMVHDGLMEKDELWEKSPTYRDLTHILINRRHPRVYVPCSIRILNERTAHKGLILDIADAGLRVAGIDAAAGDDMILQVPMMEIGELNPVRFNAICRWSSSGDNKEKYKKAGFEITQFHENGRQEWSRFLEYSYSHNRRPYVPIALHNRRQTEGSNTITPIVHKFSGTVHEVDILDFMQFLLLSHISTLVKIHADEKDEFRLYLCDGRVVHAQHGTIQGKEVFIECMKLLDGRFETLNWEEPENRTIDLPSEFLLFEAARRRDESATGIESSDEQDDIEVREVSFARVLPGGGTWHADEWKSTGIFPIYDLKNSMKQGSVVEFRNKNLILTGIQGELGERKEFLIKLADASDSPTLEFQARCEWSATIQGNLFSGYEILTASDENLKELEYLYRSAVNNSE